MKRVEYRVAGLLTGTHDSAVVLPGEDPREALVEAAIQTISTDVKITVGDVTMHLAAWQDPDHWAEDWAEAGVEDVDALVAGAVG